MRVCFVVADAREQQPTFATIYLALAAHRRGHDVRFVSVDDLSFLDDNNVLGMTTRVRAGDYAAPRRLRARPRLRRGRRRGGHARHLRRRLPALQPHPRGRGPPGAPLIDFGWRLKLGGTLVVNDPEGLRRAGSRMYLADFPADVAHATLVSRSKQRLKRVRPRARRARRS